jgi:hypothetical protein
MLDVPSRQRLSPLTARAAAGIVALALAVAGTDRVVGQAGFPARLDDYFTRVLKLTAAERQALLSGTPLVKSLDADPGKEVAVFGAVWVTAPVSAYIAAIEDIETFERGGGFRVTRKVSEPARLEDFAAMTLPDEDVADLRSCRVGDCELKLSAEALARMRQEVDWTRPDAKAQVERLMRDLARDYVNAYREGGNARLAVYRDGDNPTFVANEFAELVKNMPELGVYLPDMRQYLLEYPRPPSQPIRSFVYWQEVEFGLKPTIRLNHVAIQEGADGAIVASKQLYSSHYFWTALEVRVLVPDPSRGTGFWFVNLNRSRSDGLTGFVGRIIRGKVREGARSGLEAGLAAVKRTLER